MCLLHALQIYKYFTGSACAWAVLLLMANGCGMCWFLVMACCRRSTAVCIHKKAQENTHTVFPRPLQLLQRRNPRQGLLVLTAARKS
ncbi:hypothetical protein [Comamonas terrigena]|uniref:hypothetical protein n=1 Tax=Comamonas terrigena TaxID=32013 RepID=UPI0028AFF974|nr:hypothetical protein [Comamonas terrigena]